MNKKHKRRKRTNQGNSFVIVIATLSFLAVLTTALLVAVAVCYRMKAYDINSRDNFYYLEKAMDELYDGVGSIAMEHLTEAYNSVTDVIVVYDTEKKAYVTMNNEDANKLLDSLFIDKMWDDSRFNTKDSLKNTLKGFVKTVDENGNPNGISLELNGFPLLSENKESIVFQDIVLKRKAQYSTVNSYKDSDKMAEPAEYVQSITTDMVITAPAFSVDFSSVDNDELYDYVMISDMGIEIDGVNRQSVINGNIYAANDFYNKVYNDSSDTKVSPYRAYKDESGASVDEIPDKYNGLDVKSMYSGLYVSKAKVSIIADRIIVPGSIAAMDSAELSIVGSGKETPKKKKDGSDFTTDDNSVTNHKLSQVWADNIVLGGYSKNLTDVSTGENKGYKGADIELSADAFISDDLELNALGSKYVLDGSYYGYSNATSDQRAFGRAYLRRVLGIDDFEMSELKQDDLADGNYVKNDGTILNLPGQSHYNSSAIVVNGEDSELNLAKTDAVYIAGQAYVEMSKAKKEKADSLRETVITTDGYEDRIDASKHAEDQSEEDYREEVEADEVNPYSYKNKSDNNYSDYHETYEWETDPDGDLELDADGNPTLTYSKEYSNGTSANNKRIEDYRTGESISVKGNQLAYIPPYLVSDPDPVTGRVTVKWPQILKDDDYFKTIFPNMDEIPVVKTVVDDNTYYFYDFTNTNVNLSEFITHYAGLFYKDKYKDGYVENTRTKGDLADLYDITGTKYFSVDSILIDEDRGTGADEHKNKIYTNGAISVKTDADETLRIIGDSKRLTPLLKAKDDLDLSTSLSATGDAKLIDSVNLSKDLKNRYKELKYLLTDDQNLVKKSDEALKDATETSITPINTYFDFSYLNGDAKNSKYEYSFKSDSHRIVNANGELEVANNGIGGNVDNIVDGAIILQSNYQIYSSTGDVVVKDDDNDGKVMGVVICRGDVTFDNNVKEFHGLIVAGGKIKIVDQDINLVANREVVKAVLQECSTSTIEDDALRHFALLFKSYSGKVPSSGAGSSTEIISSMKSVSSVEYEDVLGFNNWRKNID